MTVANQGAISFLPQCNSLSAPCRVLELEYNLCTFRNPTDFGVLRSHLQFGGLVRKAVLVEEGAPLTHVYLPQGGGIWRAGFCISTTGPAARACLPLMQEILAQMIGVQRNAVSLDANARQQEAIAMTPM